MSLPPLAVGVCSWSLQVKSVPELRKLLDRLGVNTVQIACGDPHHADWQEGDRLPEAARAAGFTLTGAMLGFPGEDYTTPQTIQKSGGFGNPATRAERHWRAAPDAAAHGLLLGATGALVGFFASSLVNYNFGDAEVTLMLWWLMAAVVKVTADEEIGTERYEPRNHTKLHE